MEMFYNGKLGGRKDCDSKGKGLNGVKFKVIGRMFGIGKEKRKWEVLKRCEGRKKLDIEKWKGSEV